jgi:hypothetical protein
MITWIWVKVEEGAGLCLPVLLEKQQEGKLRESLCLCFPDMNKDFSLNTVTHPKI